MTAVEGFGGGGDDRGGQGLIVTHPVGEGVAVHLALAFLVEGQDRGPGGPGQIAAQDDFDGEDGEFAADHDIGVGIFQHMIGADIGGVIEPETGGLGQDLAFEGDRGEDAVEGGDPVGGDQNPAVIGQVITIADLAKIGVRQLRDTGMIEDTGQVGHLGLLSDGGSIGRGRGRVNRCCQNAEMDSRVHFDKALIYMDKRNFVY